MVKPPEGLEIIPPEILQTLTPDKVDWVKSRLIDDNGDMWIDIKVRTKDVDDFIDGKPGYMVVAGRRII